MARRHDSRKRRAARPRSKVSRKIRIPVERTDVPPDFSIVGIGASAGGFEAFTQMLDAMPPDPKLAMVFVQHLAPKHASSLASLLAGSLEIAGQRSGRGGAAEANHVYVVPPNVQMELVDGHLHLGRARRSHPVHARSIFSSARSPARSQNHAIGVVLSGTASDGSARRARNQVDGRYHGRAGSVDGQIRRHAAFCDRHADDRPRAFAEGHRDQARADREASIPAGTAGGHKASHRADRSPRNSSTGCSRCSCRRAASTSCTTRRRRSSGAFSDA